MVSILKCIYKPSDVNFFRGVKFVSYQQPFGIRGLLLAHLMILHMIQESILFLFSAHTHCWSCEINLLRWCFRCKERKLWESYEALDHFLCKYSGPTVSMHCLMFRKCLRPCALTISFLPETGAASEHSFHQYTHVDNNKLVFVLRE